jgi:hypothetical protein
MRVFLLRCMSPDAAAATDPRGTRAHGHTPQDPRHDALDVDRFDQVPLLRRRALKDVEVDLVSSPGREVGIALAGEQPRHLRPSIASRSSSPGHRDHVDLDRPIRQVDLVIGVTARVLCLSLRTYRRWRKKA